jgi:hypothetical protein
MVRLSTNARRAAGGGQVAATDEVGALGRARRDDVGGDPAWSAAAPSLSASRAEEAGLIRTTPTTPGHRTLTVELTPRGHEVVERDVEALIGRERELVAHLPAADREQLAGLPGA